MPTHALSLKEGTSASAKSIAAYNFGAADYTIVMMVHLTAGGTLVSRSEFAQGVLRRMTRGFQFVVGKEATGWRMVSFEQAYTALTVDVAYGQAIPLNDGQCHYVAYVRNKNKFVHPKEVTLILDGSDITQGSPRASFSDISSSADLMIGGQYVDPKYWLAGSVMNVGLWNRALFPQEIEQAAFGLVSSPRMDIPNGPTVEVARGMMGYWSMNENLEDSSPNKNTLVVTGDTTFVPCHSCMWTSGRNNYTFCQIAGGGHPPEKGLITTTRMLEVALGTSAVYGALMGVEPSFKFPADVQVTMTDPKGKVYDTAMSSDTVFVQIDKGHLRSFMLINPPSGQWKISITAPAQEFFRFQFHSIPSADASSVMTSALKPILSTLPTGQHKRDVFSSLGHIAVAGFAGVLGGAAVVLSGGAAIPAVVAGLVAFSAVIEMAGAKKINAEQAQWVIQDVHDDEFENSLDKVSGLLGFTHTTDKILLIDPNVESDQGTTITAKWRMKSLPLSVMLSRFNGQMDQLSNTKVTRVNVRNALLDKAVKYVSASGHGQSNELLGYVLPGTKDKLETILSSDKYAPAEVAGKVFHFLACNTGVHSAVPDFGLGENLVKHGALAFIGYKDRYEIKTAADVLPDGRTLEQVFVECDMAIDIKLLQGETVLEALNAAKGAFDSAIQELKTAQGNFPDAIRILAKNRDLLVCYGDANARIVGHAADER